MGEIGLGLADDGELHHHLVGQVLHLDLVHHADDIRIQLALIDDLGIGDQVLEFGDLDLQQTLRLAGRFILGVFGQVALLAGLRDLRGNDRTLGERFGEVGLDLVEAVRRHVMDLWHITVWLFDKQSNQKRVLPRRQNPFHDCKYTNYFYS